LAMCVAFEYICYKQYIHEILLISHVRLDCGSLNHHLVHIMIVLLLIVIDIMRAVMSTSSTHYG